MFASSTHIKIGIMGRSVNRVRTKAIGTLISHVYPLSKQNVSMVFPPERKVKYAQCEKAYSGMQQEHMRISFVASSRTVSVVL